MKHALAYVVVVVAGLATAGVGAVAHRAFPPVGLIAAVVMVLFAAAFSRAWLTWSGLAAFASGWGVATFVLALEGSGGSVLIAQDALGLGWLIGCAIAIVAAAAIPSRMIVGSHVAS